MDVDEAAIVIPLITSDTRFRKFYTAERPRIRVPIEWHIAPDAVPADGHACAVAHHTATGVWRAILLRGMPTPHDDLLVAHELMHHVCWLEGFPLLIGKDAIAQRLEYFFRDS